MNVLSLFDGMSCGQIALRELGVEPEVYYASEIDKYAIRQTQYNFPATVQLGDVERWREWEIDWAGIDLVLAGSPCQGFSFAGKQLAFDDPRSRLFFVFADILTHVRKANPNVRFLLENVNMKREYLRVISEHVGVSPVRINSALVSAQNRNRWYWTDIKTRREGLFGELHSDIPQPEDRGIVLRDVLESGVCWREKSYTLRASAGPHQGMSNIIRSITTNGKYGYLGAAEPMRIGTIESGTQTNHDSKPFRVYSPDGKAVTLQGEAGGYGAKTGLYAVPVNPSEFARGGVLSTL